jgi:hypothetical protein
MPTITNTASFRQAGIAAAASAVISRTPTPAACCCPACAGLECLSRTRFFAGQLLSEADLNNEQSYLLAKNRLHNRYLVGTGVVCGLQVVCSNCDGWVTVRAGYAIDACGDDIIVCQDQPFDVISAINACCKPVKQNNCTPPRPAPPATCKDAEQKWCITIQYKEQPTRSVAPLKPTTSTCSCGCGGASSKGGCGCGGSHGTSTSTASSCCCSSATTATASPASTACEPSRILETFQLGVCQSQDDTLSVYTAKPVSGMAAQIKACLQPLEKLVLQAPNLAVPGMTNQAAYSAACNFLAQVKKYLATASITHCDISAGVNGTQIIANTSNAALQAQVDGIVQQLSAIAMECICLAAMPSCPPSPCDDCLVLACVTVRDGKVIDICHFDGGRKQIISFPSLLYWLSALGVELGSTITAKLEELCCANLRQVGDKASYASAFYAAKRPVEDISSSDFGSAALFSQLFSTGIAQQLGASLLNAATNSTDTVDLRPLVGQNLQTVTASLERFKIQSTQSDASQLSDYELATSAPAAFPISQPLTILTSNQLVVGFQATSPIQQLKSQISQLQSQVDALQKQIGGNTSSRTKKG